MFRESPLTLEDFKSLISSKPPDRDTDPKKVQAYLWFMDYIKTRAEGIFTTVPTQASANVYLRENLNYQLISSSTLVFNPLDAANTP